jgi:cell division protein FtsI/penicillin-binding protein 2
MAGAIDAGKVTPDTTYTDTGSIKLGGFTIRNAADKSYGPQSMVGVLKESINTGAVFAAQKLGLDLFKKYAQNFGFGGLTGIELKTEVPGNVSSLNKKSDVYLATASFGQGITATPLQLAMAFSVFANQGKLMKPYIVEEVRGSDGTVTKTTPTVIRQVISPRTAQLISGMLAVVVKEGHAKAAQVGGYVLAGKTGTAQVPDLVSGGYTEETEQTFVGYGPIDDPQFVMLVKFSQPERRFAEYTSVPVFGAIADFMLKYLEVPN